MIPCSCEFCYQLRLSINGLIFERDPIQRWVSSLRSLAVCSPTCWALPPPRMAWEMGQLRIASGYKDI
jgi:hypothetical protein